MTPGRSVLAFDERLRETERFITVVSHELRQPLNAVLAALHLLETDSSQDTSVKARRVMHRQLQHMSRLLDDILDMSRLTMQSLELKMEPLDLRAVIEAAAETVATRAAERQQRLRLSQRAHPLAIRGDALRLQQVFANLLSNAVRYTPDGGTVSVELRKDSGWAVSEITDTGQGIDPEDLETIFEPFQRGASSGSEGFGIGLTLARGLIQLHGGTIGATSAGRGHGSTFIVRLPELFDTKSE